MKRGYGRLAVFAVLVMTVLWLTMPVRHVSEDPSEAIEMTMTAGETQPMPSCPDGAEYVSSEPRVADVDSAGTVMALSAGHAALRAYLNGKTLYEVDLTVKAAEVVSLTLNTSAVTLSKGEVSALVATDSTTGEKAAVTWSSSDPDMVSVDAQGRIVANAVGTATITARDASGAKVSARVTVTVATKGLAIKEHGVTIGVGSVMRLTPVFTPEDATENALSWGSSDPSIVSVDDNGVITAHQPGLVIVGASGANDTAAETSILVEDYTAALTMDIGDTVTMERGTQMTLPVTLTPEGHFIQYESSNTDCVTVDDTGLVTAVKSGQAILTVTADGQTKRCIVTVVTTVQTVTLNMTEIYLLAEQTDEPFQLSAAVEPADADDTALAYSSDNTLVANVTKDGLVTLTGGYGTAVITARAQGGASASFTVHVVTELPSVEN